jgi:hypothetical protein
VGESGEECEEGLGKHREGSEEIIGKGLGKHWEGSEEGEA